MSTYFNPTKRITVSQLEEIFQKYDELNIEEVAHNIFESTEKDDAGLPILIDAKNYVIQSTFKKDLVYPYREFKSEQSNFLVVYCHKDHSNEDDYYVSYFRMTGSDPHHIIKIIQYETEIVINDENDISDYLKYEHFGTTDLHEVGERIWSEMDDDEKEPFQIKLTPEQHEEWWIIYGRWLEEEIDLLEKALNLSNDFKRKKLKQLWFEYEQTSKTKFLNKLKAA